jgi:hypothetical protein
VDRFQSGCLDVLICTYGVGATGITLTKSHTVILLDRPWTPGDVLQAEDRIRRIGQQSDVVHSIWVSKFPVDDKLDKLLQTKDSNCQIVLSEPNTTGSRKWFNNNPTSNAVPSISKPLTNFFQPGRNRPQLNGKESVCVGHAMRGDESDIDTQIIGWNVRECAEEATQTTNSVMSELVRALL